jgi:hypothetical protein
MSWFLGQNEKKEMKIVRMVVLVVCCAPSARMLMADGDAGGVLRAFGADDDVDDGDDNDGDCERRSNTDGRGGKPGVVT